MYELHTIKDSVKEMHLSGSVRVIDYQPGNGARYFVTFTDVSGLPPYVLNEILGAGYMMVVHNMGNHCALGVYRGMHAPTLAEKLCLTYADAEALVRLIDHICTGGKFE